MSPMMLTAQNKPNSGAQQTDCQLLSTPVGVARIVHVMPSNDVIARLLVPELETAQNIANSELQHTDVQLLSAGVVRLVQVTPSGEVITRLAVPELATAQNMPNSALQHTLFHAVVVAAVLFAHADTALIPSDLLEKLLRLAGLPAYALSLPATLTFAEFSDRLAKGVAFVRCRVSVSFVHRQSVDAVPFRYSCSG